METTSTLSKFQGSPYFLADNAYFPAQNAGRLMESAHMQSQYLNYMSRHHHNATQHYDVQREKPVWDDHCLVDVYGRPLAQYCGSYNYTPPSMKVKQRRVVRRGCC
eukprot:Lankesteria_metandrocarpae@DN2714_c0_g1_i1.p2